MRTITALLFSALFAVPVAGAADPAIDYEHPELTGALAAIDAWISGTQHYERIPGISVGIVHDQQLIFARGYGASNLESGRPADADTLYSVCSISKLFTAIAVMQQRDAGRLSLRDPVSRHLDWFEIEQNNAGSPPVRIEGLLTHSSGLPRESDYPYWRGPDFPFPTREEMIGRLDDQEMLYASERRFQYSNLGLSLAGEIVVETSGQPYRDYVNEHIITPLGMRDTRPYYPEKLRGEQLAIGYTGLHRNLARDPVPPFFTRGITAAAGFTSSVRDLARFASWQFRLLGDGDGLNILDPNTLREMHRVHWVDPDWETSWGLGFVVRQHNGRTVVSHGGGCPGYITSFSTVPSEKVAAIVLTNAGDGPAWRLANGILDTIIPALAAAESEPEAVADLSAYEGNYEGWPWGGELAIRQHGDRLALIDLPVDSLGSDTITYLRRIEGDEFKRLSDSGDELESWRFERDDTGRVSRVWKHSGYLSRLQP